MNRILLLVGFQSMEGFKLRPEDGVGHHFHALLAGPLDGTRGQSYGGPKTLPVGTSQNWFRWGIGLNTVANVEEAKYDHLLYGLEFVRECSGFGQVRYRLAWNNQRGNALWGGAFEMSCGRRGLVSCSLTEVGLDFFWPPLPAAWTLPTPPLPTAD